MLEWPRTWYEAARLRDAAVATIRPLVEASRRRLNGVPNSIWLEPYIVGLLVMLITITTKRTSHPIRQSTLCRVQAAAWQRITGIKYRIGEEVILLSEAHDQQFMAGCVDANRIAEELYGTDARPSYDGRDPAWDTLSLDVDTQSTPDIAAWHQTFERYVVNRL